MGRFCGNCFNNSLNEQEICTICGFDAATNRQSAPHGLPPGTILNGRYIIGRVLGQGGFGITYTARDYQTNELVAVKEFFPDSMATRSNHTLVTPFLGERGENFSYGLRTFLQEAETMAKFIGNANIVRVYSYFEENNTAYFVMEYVNGVSLQSHLKAKGGQISFEEAISILFPIMDALSVVHEAGIIHRDVAPDNIYIARDGTVKLLDFGAARYSLGNVSRSLDVILKHGFAPKEQYKRRGRQGPYTDVYSVGATLYYAITGVRPDDAIERSDEDDMPYPTSLGARITQQQEAVLLKAMAVDYQDRYQTMAEFKNTIIQSASQKDTSLLSSLRKQKEQLKQEALRKKEELRKQEEERRRQEELRKQEEERRRQEELRKQEEERRRQEELRKQEEERRRKEELRKKQEEERRKLENERRRQEELRKKEEIRKQKDLLKQEQLQKKEEAKQEKLRRKQEKKAKRKSRKGLVVLLAGAAAAGVLAFVMTQTDLIELPFSSDVIKLSVSDMMSPTDADTVPTEPIFTEVFVVETKPVEILPEIIISEETEPTEAPVATPLTGNISQELSFNSESGGTMTHVFGENLKIMVKNNYDVTVTVTGLEMKDQYEILDGAKEVGDGYNWSLDIYERLGSKRYAITATPHAKERHKGVFSLADSRGRVSAISGDGKEKKLKNAEFSYTEDSIIWKFTMDEDAYINFKQLDKIAVNIKDPSLDLDMERLYKRSTMKLEALDPAAPSLIVNPSSDIQNLLEEELSFTPKRVTPISLQEGGTTPNVVQILDKPVNSCLSVSAEIVVEQGDPEEFIVYIQDLERWREIGRIPNSGEKAVTGTISFDELTSIDSFAIAPSGGSGESSISYKLTTAQVYGYGLQTSRSGKNITFSGADLSVQVYNDKYISVTLSGLSLQDEMPSKLDEVKGTEEYKWSVNLISGNYRITFQTECPVPVIKYGQPKITIWKEMKHSFVMDYLEFGEEVDHFVKRAIPKITHTNNSITWTYELDDYHPFDFHNGIIAQIDWFDRANNESMHMEYFGR